MVQYYIVHAPSDQQQGLLSKQHCDTKRKCDVYLYRCVYNTIFPRDVPSIDNFTLDVRYPNFIRKPM